MSNSDQEQRLYSVSIEGVPMTLDQMGLANEVIAQWALGENQEALIVADPEQVGKLHDLLHVRSVEPVTNGLYADRSGKWFAIKSGEVVETGSWMVPLDVLQSISTGDATNTASAVAGDTPSTTTLAPDGEITPAREIDPVCGAVMRPGQEAANVNYHGHTYHFCSDECRKLFLKNPGDYVKQAAMSA